MSKYLDYWMDCISEGASNCGLSLTDEQLKCLAESAEGGHDHYDMAFYSPPPSDRIGDIEREWKGKLDAMKKEHDQYRCSAEKAIKDALNVHRDDNVRIGENGSVFRIDGRTTQIQ